MKASDLPDFNSMPAVKGMPHGCAWGLFDGKNGERDNLGTLNLLEPEVVLAARDEIKTGISVSVNWDLDKPYNPGFNRRKTIHKFIDLSSDSNSVHDDEIHINTQISSQWDGFKHYHSASSCYYNGLKHADVPSSMDNGIHHWNDRGGIVGRGVLLDYVRYAEKKGIKYDVMTCHKISVDVLDEMAKDQGVELKPADILIIRSGFTKWYETASEEDRDSKIANADFWALEWTGVEGSPKTVEWLWNHHFAAVAGDSISWEQWPFNKDCEIHQYQLAMWGSPIGEIWDLERLAEVCEEQKRWSFFFTSAPLNIPGGVASPPNAICIF